jgi:Mg2+ and Co2+ transporter CorA
MAGKNRMIRSLVWLLMVSITWTGSMATVQAAMISSTAQASAEQGSYSRDQIHQMLASQSVQDQLVSMGVDPEQAKQRIAALSDSEMQTLNQKMAELPKGGILGLIGAVFVVLLVLEIVGVINIFNKA